MGDQDKSTRMDALASGLTVAVLVFAVTFGVSMLFVWLVLSQG